MVDAGRDFRIVSLVPSLTATIADLGLASSIVGCTSFCVRPKGIYKQATVLGGTKDPDLARVKALMPTHILVNDEENRREDIDACRGIARTISCLPMTIPDSIGLIGLLAREFSVDAATLIKSCERLYSEVRAIASHSPFASKRFLYLIWKKPYMAATANTFVSEAASLLGLENALSAQELRYPELGIEVIKNTLKPDVVFFSTEPYPFRRRDLLEFRSAWAEDPPEMYIIDGQLCSWWGSLTRDLLEAAHQFLTTGDGVLLKPYR